MAIEKAFICFHCEARVPIEEPELIDSIDITCHHCGRTSEVVVYSDLCEARGLAALFLAGLIELSDISGITTQEMLWTIVQRCDAAGKEFYRQILGSSSPCLDEAVQVFRASKP